MQSINYEINNTIELKKNSSYNIYLLRNDVTFIFVYNFMKYCLRIKLLYI